MTEVLVIEGFCIDVLWQLYICGPDTPSSLLCGTKSGRRVANMSLPSPQDCNTLLEAYGSELMGVKKGRKVRLCVQGQYRCNSPAEG